MDHLYVIVWLAQDNPVWMHCSRSFGPLLLTDVLEIFMISGLSLGNPEFQLPPNNYWVQVWPLARPLQDLIKPLISWLGCVFWVIANFSAFTGWRRLLSKVSWYLAPFCLYLNTMQSYLHASKLGCCCWDCSPNKASWVYTKKIYFNPSPMPPLGHPERNFANVMWVVKDLNPW